MNMDINKNDLADNPTNRVPICLLLDISSSMEGEPINELNEGFKIFISDLKSDVLTKYSADLCVITFGGSYSNNIEQEVKIIKEFGPLDELKVEKFEAYGYTPMGEAVNTAVELLNRRKEEFKENMVQYFQPWLVVLTDGEPTDEYLSAANKVSSLINSQKLTIFPVGVGDDFNEEVLQQFSPNAPILRLKGTKFKQFFQWLSASVQQVSASNPGDTVKPKSTAGWSTLDNIFGDDDSDNDD